MDIESRLANFVVETKYEDLGKEVVDATKRDILDTIGVALCGSSAMGVRPVVDFVSEMGGKESATVFAYWHRVPPSSAALANSTMGHALDYDDCHDGAIHHTGVVVVPAAFAIAEYIGKVTGKEIITAIALGIDIHCRLGLATKHSVGLSIGWMLTPLYGYFGAATAASKLLRLDEEGVLNSWGIAYSQAAGNTEMIVDGGLTKRLQAGLAASGGITSALLARGGITGARHSFLRKRWHFQPVSAGRI